MNDFERLLEYAFMMGYNDALHEESPISRAIYAIGKAKNKLMYKDENERKINNRLLASTLGRIKAAARSDEKRDSVHGDKINSTNRIHDYRKLKEIMRKADNNYSLMTRVEDRYKNKAKKKAAERERYAKPAFNLSMDY